MAASFDRITNLRTGATYNATEAPTVRAWHSKPAKPLKPVHRRSKALRRASDDLQLAVVLTALMCVCLSMIS